MTLEQALHTHLAGLSGLTALVGARLYRLKMPDSAVLPAVTYSLVSHVPVRELAGVAFMRARFQISAWARSNGAAKAVVAEIRAAMQDLTGRLADGIEVLDSSVIGESDLYDADTDIHHVPMDVMILYH